MFKLPTRLLSSPVAANFFDLPNSRLPFQYELPECGSKLVLVLYVAKVRSYTVYRQRKIDGIDMWRSGLEGRGAKRRQLAISPRILRSDV